MTTTIALAGSTGSIGTQTLEVVAAEPDRYEVVALGATGRNLDQLAAQVDAVRPRVVAIADETRADAARERLRDVEVRVGQHNAGLFPESYTFRRRPVTLAFAEHFPSITDAIAVERRVKGWSRRKKRAMIDGEWEMLPQLARRRT